MKSDDRTSTAHDVPRSTARTSGPTAQLPVRIEQAMLEILNRPVPDDEPDLSSRERELRGLFLVLDANQAHDLIRRFDAGDDPLAQAFRRFIRRRR